MNFKKIFLLKKEKLCLKANMLAGLCSAWSQSKSKANCICSADYQYKPDYAKAVTKIGWGDLPFP